MLRNGSELPADELRKKLTDIGSIAESAMRELREAIYGLRWSNEGENSFGERLRRYAEEVERLSSTSVEMTLEGNTEVLSANQKTALYRVICEAVGNAVQHGKAGNIVCEIEASGESTHAKISDNGEGFNLETLPKRGQGLRNLQYIATMLKGTLTIDSMPGRGTVIELTLPR